MFKQNMSEKVQFDLTGEFDDRNYKSCFARSVAVNSQYKQTKSLDFSQVNYKEENKISEKEVAKKAFENFTTNCRSSKMETPEIVRLRKNTRNGSLDESRRLSCSSLMNNRRASMCSSRISEIPVENIVHQSKIQTLEWQLKEIEKSREMYRAVMKQVVTFLEKAHHSLGMLGGRLNGKGSVQRSKSEQKIRMDGDRKNSEENGGTLTNGLNGCLEDDRVAFRDFHWQRHKKPDVSPEEIPPEKLSKEAYRLLRTATSLLNTREPDLAQLPPQNDIEFLAQLAQEFPQTPPQHKIPQKRATSFSLSPKLILPETEKISTAFNRKLSLQLSEVRRNCPRGGSFGGGNCGPTPQGGDSARGSVAESESDFLSSTMINDFGNGKGKEKSNSPAAGSISSVEDESGFSSMNSFQDVGLPLVNCGAVADEVSTKNALLRSMLHNNSDYSSLNCSLYNNNYPLDNTLLSNADRICDRKPEEERKIDDDVKLWQKPASSTAQAQHKRWRSASVDEPNDRSMKVLWV